ncbi:hypothetical protein AB0M12_40310 [Nocardia vinacea]|uniref:hypothetical protein n=1 Tax=Nocardia vinacea TaxID=96468 RepID=UPI00344224F6
MAPSSGSGVGIVAAMFALLGGVVLVTLLVLAAVVVAFPSHDYSTVPTTRQLGPCEPFCSLRTTTAVPVGGEQR